MRPATAALLQTFSDPGQRLRVVVKEAGSLPLATQNAGAFDETIIIAQMNGEAEAEFAERVIERFKSIGRSRRRLCAATLQVGAVHDAETTERRRTLLVALMKQASASGEASELVVEAPSSLGAEGHEGLLSLVDDLLQRPECATLHVRLRFLAAGDVTPDADSGVFWLPPPA